MAVPLSQKVLATRPFRIGPVLLRREDSTAEISPNHLTARSASGGPNRDCGSAQALYSTRFPM